MLQKLAMIFGVILLLLGVLGFVPGITNDQLLLGIFYVNPLHNIINLVAGAIALWASFTSVKAAKMYFQIFGIIFALLAVLGFFTGEGLILGLISNNTPDLVLHLILAAVALYAGFGMKAQANPMMSTPPAM